MVLDNPQPVNLKDWPKNKYLKVEDINGKEVVLSNWQQGTTLYENTRRLVVQCDVLKIEKEEFPQGELIWQTTSAEAVHQLWPIFGRAVMDRETAVSVYMEFKGKSWKIVDMKVARGAMK